MNDDQLLRRTELCRNIAVDAFMDTGAMKSDSAAEAIADRKLAFDISNVLNETHSSLFSFARFEIDDSEVIVILRFMGNVITHRRVEVD